MTLEQARRAIVDEWLALHPGLRATDKQRKDFAVAASGRVRFPEKGDRAETIQSWITEAEKSLQAP